MTIDAVERLEEGEEKVEAEAKVSGSLESNSPLRMLFVDLVDAFCSDGEVEGSEGAEVVDQVVEVRAVLPLLRRRGTSSMA